MSRLADVALRALFNGDGWSLGKPYFFEGEERRIQADLPEQLPDLLSSLDNVATSNDPDLIAIGFITYEAGVALEGSASLFRRPEGTPLASFGVFRRHDAARSAPALRDAEFTFEGGVPATPEASLSPPSVP